MLQIAVVFIPYE